MHDHQWAAVDRKLEEAQQCYEEMGRSLAPPESTHMNVALQAAGVILDTRWQDSFYRHVGTFLHKVRSVPSIIEARFGADCSRPMKRWFDSLPPDERRRRQTFSDQFRGDREAFRQHPLTNERDVTEHRLGFPNIEGKIDGPFGKVHTASPTSRIPTAECRPLEPNINNDPALQWAATLPPRPIQPRWDQFTINGRPLFAECQAYLQLARDVRERAGKICDVVHGGKALSTPPSS
jgi:hypothetical protein